MRLILWHFNELQIINSFNVISASIHPIIHNDLRLFLLFLQKIVFQQHVGSSSSLSSHVDSSHQSLPTAISSVTLVTQTGRWMGQLDDRVERFRWYCLNAAEQTWFMRKQIFLSHYQRFKTNNKICRTVATIQLHLYKITKYCMCLLSWRYPIRMPAFTDLTTEYVWRLFKLVEG